MKDFGIVSKIVSLLYENISALNMAKKKNWLNLGLIKLNWVAWIDRIALKIGYD